MFFDKDFIDNLYSNETTIESLVQSVELLTNNPSITMEDVYCNLVELYWTDKNLPCKLLSVIDAVKPLKFYVYVLTLDGEVVYIGSSTDLYTRLISHGVDKDFNGIMLQEVYNKQDMLTLEMYLIDKYRPPLNKALNMRLANLCVVPENLVNLFDYRPKVISCIPHKQLKRQVYPFEGYLPMFPFLIKNVNNVTRYDNE